MSFRFAPFLRQRLFTTSTRARAAIPLDGMPASQFPSAGNNVPKLGKVAKWYLPSMAAIAIGMKFYFANSSQQSRSIVTLDAANRHIGFGVTNALHEANRKVHMALEPTQEEKNQQLMNLYGERSSLEDMERAFAGVEAATVSTKDRAKLLEEAYGDRGSLKDLEKAMQLYEVQ